MPLKCGNSFKIYTPTTCNSILFKRHLWNFLISGGVEFLQWTRSRRTINCSIGWDAAAVPHLARFWCGREYSVSCHSCRIWCDNRKGTHYYVQGVQNSILSLLPCQANQMFINPIFKLNQIIIGYVIWFVQFFIQSKVIGQSGVVFIDVTHAHHDPHSTYFSISNVLFHYLTTDDQIGLRNLNISFSPKKTPMRGHENYDHALTSNDIFYGKHRTSDHKPEFTRAATSVFDSRLDTSTHGDTYESHPTFRVTLTRTAYSAGYVERKSSFHTDLTSYENLVVSIAGRNWTCQMISDLMADWKQDECFLKVIQLKYNWFRRTLQKQIKCFFKSIFILLSILRLICYTFTYKK